MESALTIFKKTLEANRTGAAVAVCSVCSSHPYAIRAALRQAERDETIALIESTSNQVNQYGGYTGMHPSDFKNLVLQIAAESGFPADRILFGGDHLGPFPWHHEAAAKVLPMAEEMVREYVQAGYAKIHLDVSMYLGDDTQVAGTALDPEIVARRTAALCKVAEQTWKETRPHDEPPVYIIGNEVPVPGGTSAEQGELRPSSPDDVADFVSSMQREFRKNDLDSAWSRVAAVVVQPGVEFGDNLIHEYQPDQARGLIALVPRLHGLVYEAHSTDYQLQDSLAALVRDHFGILKVGPAMTFAFREAVVALEAIEREVLGAAAARDGSNLLQSLVGAMRDDDRYWKNYYQGNHSEIELAIRYSYSDRIRYYWTTPASAASLQKLLDNLTSREIPLTLLSQYMPLEYEEVRLGALSPLPETLVLSHIMRVTGTYSAACGAR